jgi:hypothetical protein
MQLTAWLFESGTFTFEPLYESNANIDVRLQRGCQDAVNCAR